MEKKKNSQTIPKESNNNQTFTIFLLSFLLIISLALSTYSIHRTTQLRNQIAQSKYQVAQPSTNSSSLREPEPTPSPKTTTPWMTYIYNKKSFESVSPNFLDYEYKGKISFRYPATYNLKEYACHTAYHPDKGKYCYNMGGLLLSKGESVKKIDFLEFFDLRNENHRQHFYNHNLISENTLEGYKYDVKRLKTNLDTAPSPGYENRALVYSVDTNLIGFLFTLREDLEISKSEMDTIEEEILQIIKTIEVE